MTGDGDGATARSVVTTLSEEPNLAPVYAVAAATALLAVCLTLTVHRAATTGLHLTWWTLIPAFTAAEVWRLHVEVRRQAHSFSLSAIPMVIGLFCLPPDQLIVARVAGSAIVFIAVHRSPPFKTAVNISAHWLEVAAGIVAFQAIIGHAGSHPLGPIGWLAAGGATVTGDALSLTAIAVAIATYQRAWDRDFGRTAVACFAATLANTALALLALVVVHNDPYALVLVAVVLTILAVAYRSHTALVADHRTLQQLYGYSQTLGVSVSTGTVAPVLLHETRELVHAERAWLLTPGQAGTVIHDEPEPHNRSRQLIDLDAALIGVLTAAGVVHWSQNRQTPEGALVGAAGLSEILAVSIPGIDEISRVLVVADRIGEVRGFNNDDATLLETIAAHGSIGLDNGSLVEKLRTESEARLFQATYDALTGLPNRATFEHHVAAVIDQGPATVILIDLDRFKEVNDTLGHRTGDALLMEIGNRLTAEMEADSFVARLGGDEFGILTSGTDPAVAMAMARRVVAIIEQAVSLQDLEISVEASAGVAIAPLHATSAETLLQRADVAMYTAKHDRSGVALYTTARDGYSPERLTLIGDLRRGLALGQVVTWFQPQADSTTGQLVGAEALVRWIHPDRGLIAPDDFIPVAEHTGLIGPLTHAVLDQAMTACESWRAMGMPLRVSVNLSARNLAQSDLCEDIVTLLHNHDLDPSDLCLEVTESLMLIDQRVTITVLQQLAATGIHIALDDFGTGYSSMSYLQRLPVHELKIDKSFVIDLGDSPTNDALVRSMIDLGHNLGLTTVAEGVEDRSTWDRVRAMGCDVVQGYGLARPKTPEQFTRWLADQRMTGVKKVATAPLPISAVVSRVPRGTENRATLATD